MKHIILITILVSLLVVTCLIKRQEHFAFYGNVTTDSCLGCANIKTVINKINSIENKIKTFTMPPKSRDCIGYWKKKDCGIPIDTDLFGNCPKKLTTAEFITMHKQSGDGRKCPTDIFRNDYPCKIGRKCNMFLIQNTIDNKYLYIGRNSVQTKWINIDNIKNDNKFKIGSVFIFEKYPMSDNTYKIRGIYDNNGITQTNSNFWYMDGYGGLSRGAYKSTASRINVTQTDNDIYTISIGGRHLLTDKNNKYYKAQESGSWGYPKVYLKSPNSVNFTINNKIRLIPYYGNELFY
jgi:hypothetical protein